MLAVKLLNFFHYFIIIINNHVKNTFLFVYEKEKNILYFPV